MKKTDNYTIRPLSPELLNDYLAFFENDAFADNTHWASCYCYFHYAPFNYKQWKQRTMAQNRTAVSQLIRDSRMHGYLAYSAGKPVAWCNAAPRKLMTTLQEEKELPADQIGSIVCFVVAKSNRGRGLARRLLKAACNGFLQQGLQYAEAYPMKEALGEAANHMGPLSMYLDEGFEPIREVGETVIVRKKLW